MTFLETVAKILLAPGAKYLIKQYVIAVILMIFYIVSNINREAYSVLTLSYLSIVLFNTILLPYSLFSLNLITGYISRILRLDRINFITNIPFLFLLISYVVAFGFAFILAPVSFIIIYLTEIRQLNKKFDSDF